MTSVILYSVHVALAVVLAGAVWAPRGWRRAILVAASSIGCVGGIVLAVAASDGAIWRSTTLAQPRGVIVGAAAACAWLLAGARGSDRTLGSAALVGIASAGMLLATLNDWVVLALVFWLASSAALIALVVWDELRVGALLAIGISDLALVGALTLHALDDRVWTVPESVDGLPLVLALVAVVLRSGAVPLTGVWETLDSPAAPALPLMLGGPLGLLGVPLAGSGPWFAVAALAAALGLCAAALAGRNLRLSLIGSWSAWLSLGLLLAAPAALLPAALATILAVTMVALWPATHTGAHVWGGFLLGFLPPAVGWVAVVATAVPAFDRAGTRSVAWSLIAGLAPVTVAAGVALAARSARSGSHGSPDLRATVAASALLIAALGLGLAPPSALGLDPETLGDFDRLLWVSGAALLLALAAGAIAYRRAAPGAEVAPADEANTATLVYSEDPADTAVMLGVFALLALGTLATVVYLTIEGLSYGFLPPSNL